MLPHDKVYCRIKPSPISGVGVFAIKDIPKGTYVFQDENEELVWIDRSEIKGLPSEIKRLYDDFCITNGEKLGCPKNFNQMTVTWFLNNSKTPNMGCDKDYRFFALRDIKSGEELTLDYKTYNTE